MRQHPFFTILPGVHVTPRYLFCLASPPRRAFTFYFSIAPPIHSCNNYVFRPAYKYTMGLVKLTVNCAVPCFGIHPHNLGVFCWDSCFIPLPTPCPSFSSGPLSSHPLTHARFSNKRIEHTTSNPKLSKSGLLDTHTQRTTIV